MKNLINLILRPFGRRSIRLGDYDKYLRSHQRLTQHARYYADCEVQRTIKRENLLAFLDNLPFSTAQLRQDLFVLNHFDFKEGGYFVEFGATDGIKLSNTFLLESKFSWRGILAEPATVWHESLKSNRSAAIETDCVWSQTGLQVVFKEVDGPPGSNELSTIESYASADMHAIARSLGRSYPVKTISLKDMLDKFEAPKVIDYLSIDTEGSEYEILNSFDFDQYTIKLITCEHNYTAARQNIYQLLTSRGYQRVNEDISLFDDWYILR